MIVPAPTLPARLTDFLSGAYYALAITATCIGLVAWGVRQEGRINQLEKETFTPVRAVQLEARVAVLEKDNLAQDKRLDDFNEHGTRALSVRLGELAAQLNASEERYNQINSQLVRIENIVSDFKTVQTRQQDVMERLREMQDFLNGRTRGGATRGP